MDHELTAATKEAGDRKTLTQCREIQKRFLRHHQSQFSSLKPQGCFEKHILIEDYHFTNCRQFFHIIQQHCNLPGDNFARKIQIRDHQKIIAFHKPVIFQKYISISSLT